MKKEKETMKNNLEMITTIDEKGFVVSITFIRPDGGSDKIVIDREQKKDEE